MQAAADPKRASFDGDECHEGRQNINVDGWMVMPQQISTILRFPNIWVTLGLAVAVLYTVPLLYGDLASGIEMWDS